MLGLFSYPIVGKLPPPYNSTLMPQGQRVMARYLASIGFMARGLDCGVPLMSLVSNCFQLPLSNICGGVLWQTSVFLTYNASLVDILNKQSSEHKLVMTLLRPLILCCLRHSISLKHVTCLVFKQSCRFYPPFYDRFVTGNHRGCSPISHNGPSEPSAGQSFANLRN